LDKDVEGGLDWIEALEQRATRHQDLRAVGSVQLYRGAGLLFQGDLQRGLLCLHKALELFERIGDEKEQSSCCGDLGDSCLILGELDTAERYVARMLVGAEAASSDHLLKWAYRLSGEIALARRSWCAARERLERAAHYRAHLYYSALAIRDLGWTFLAQGDRTAALQQFQDALAMAGPEMLLQKPVLIDTVLSGIDDAYQDPAKFRVFCDRVRAEHPEFESCKLSRWYLMSAEPRRDFRTLVIGFGAEGEPFAGLGSEIQKGKWQWQDPFGDGAYEVQDALIFYAANGRDLWHANLSAPRLLRTAPILNSVAGETEALAVQTVCASAFDDRPGIGGLLLWQDQENYLCLGRGTRGPCQVSLWGCLGNMDAIIGRGRLDCEPDGPVFLRLERVGEQVNALCSADGEQWFNVGSAAFPIAGPLQVGLYAVGWIDRTVYHGAYPHGTAIRFESFQLWGR
jgi:tetratricopeptide (TPR) repeat protein